MPSVARDGIAVIGMSCRFPALATTGSTGKTWSPAEFPSRKCLPVVGAGKTTGATQRQNRIAATQNGVAFLDDIEFFDRAFFGLSVREVESMDPQQRMALETAWNCFEDASVRPSSLSGKEVGVFIGASNLDYKEVLESRQSIDPHYATGIDLSVIPNRISFYFNLHGPSLPLSTACSSSLQALHLACRSLQAGECEAALAGGVSLLLTPRRFISFAKAGLLSPTGVLRSFDDKADGMVRGEGAGLLLLKPLPAAIAAGNKIVGVVRGSAINHSGRTYSLTYPSAAAQAAVIASAQQDAGIAASEISYVEAHGTGTPKETLSNWKVCSVRSSRTMPAT